MGRAVLADGYAGVGSSYFYIQVRIAYRIAHLLKGAPGGKHRERRGKNELSRRRYSGGNRHHISLGYSAVKKSLRKLLFEHSGLCRGGEVRVKNKKIVFLTELRKGGAVCLSRCFLISH